MSVEPLKTACLQHMKVYFEATVATDLFLRLPADQLLTLLQADDLQVDSEEKAFQAIVRWVSPEGKRDDDRAEYLPQLLREVRWRETNPQFRRQLIEHDSVVGENVEHLRLLSLIDNWISNPAEHAGRECPFNLNRRASSLPASLLLFGEASEGNRWSIVSYHPETGFEESVGRMRKRFYAAYVALGDSVFSIGGWIEGQGVSSRVDVFDTKERRWKLQAPLIIRRQQHAATLVTVGDPLKNDSETLILVCGGGYNQPADCGGDWQLLRACEVFDPLQCR
ncbi:hypothetical protein AAHC03_013163 [Spirometra sp. Aus1]